MIAPHGSAPRRNCDARKALLKGTQSLRTRNVASERQFLEAEVARDIAAAGLAQARTKEQMSELNLKEMKLYAPISGIVGSPSVREGTYITKVARGQSGLFQITQLDPIVVVGRVPYDIYAKRREVLKTDEKTKERLELTLVLPGGEKFLHTGRVIGGGHEFDQASQTIEMRAEFPNPDYLLRPGLNVTLQSRIKSN